jgi:hypothetical protein
MKKLLYNLSCSAILVGGIALSDELVKSDSKIIATVYVIRNGDSEKTIHRIFATKVAANKYINDFKDSHNYEIETINLKE